MTAAYLKLSVETKGEVVGPVRDRDPAKDGSIALLALEHGIVSPRDFATGMAAGARHHLPITFTKETDQTSPFFYQAIARNETLLTVDIVCFGIDSQPGLGAGRETLRFKIALKKAAVHKVELVGRTDAAAQAGQRFPLTERISLVYESIHWEWLHPKATAEDFFSSTNK